MLDITVTPLGVEALVMEDHLQVIFPEGQVLRGPDGNPIPLISAHYRFPMGKDEAIILRDKLNEAIDQLPDPPRESGLVVANNLQGVDQAVNLDAKLRG